MSRNCLAAFHHIQESQDGRGEILSLMMRLSATSTLLPQLPIPLQGRRQVGRADEASCTR
jgi:hypothetical protein